MLTPVEPQFKLNRGSSIAIRSEQKGIDTALQLLRIRTGTVSHIYLHKYIPREGTDLLVPSQ